ncbi:MAG: 16S rRNA (guanine(1207)-N(2))-methyltransferase RsmC [Vibrionaceae bacterium]
MSYSLESQIIERQLAFFSDKKVLVAGELNDTFAEELAKTAAGVSVFCTNFIYAQQMQARSTVAVHFGEQFVSDEEFDLLLLYWPKTKVLAQYLLAMLLPKLKANGEVVIVGENRSGINSAPKMFAPFGKLAKRDAARHCSFYWGECDNTPPPFVFEDWFSQYPLKFGEYALLVRALPGVFSQKELDSATHLLLENLPDMQGSALDFGCGAGVIGCAILQRFKDCRVDMVDIDALAIASAKETLRVNQLTSNVFCSNVYSHVAGKYNHIVSNPPFHAGLKTSYVASEQFLQQVGSHLLPNGTLTIVANNFLRYAPFIDAALNDCQVIAKSSKFSVYQATHA